MAVFRIRDFTGTVPRISSRYLSENQATIAENVDLYAKSIRPMEHSRPRKNLNVADTHASVKTLYWYDNKNFWWFFDETETTPASPYDGNVDVVRSPLANNAYERTYWTGYSYNEARPAWTDNSCYEAEGDKDEFDYPLYQWDLRVPRPIQTPQCTLTAGSPSDPQNVEDRTYVWTWVRRYNGIEEESAPSDPSSPLSVTPGDTVEIHLDWAGGALVQPLPQVRSPGTSPSCWTIYIYRTVSGVAGTEYQWVMEHSSWAVNDKPTENKLAEDLGDIIITEDFNEPDDDLRGLTSMPNGVLAAFKQDTNEVHFSEPYLPHAWPVKYQLMTEYPIVALAAFGESLCVATTDAPYVITGIHPAAMSMSKLELSQACVSKRSMVDMGAFVIYASPDGLVAVGSGTAEVITEQYFTKDEWQDLNPSTMHAVTWDDKYICWYDATELGGTKGGFILDSGETNAALTFLSEEQWFEAAYSDTETDKVYVIDHVSNKKVIVEWNAHYNATRDVNTNHFPGFTASNFDFNSGGTLTGSSWDNIDVTAVRQLRWSAPYPQHYDTMYRIEMTVSANTVTGDFVTIEFPNTIGAQTTYAIAAGWTGTVTLSAGTANPYRFDYGTFWDDAFYSFEEENSWVIWVYSDFGTGAISISDINIKPFWPGYTIELLRPEYKWKSKTFVAEKPINIAAGQIFGSHTYRNPVKFTLFADGEKVYEREVNDDRPFRMPTGYLAEEFEVQFEGTATEITEFHMATSMRDLKAT